MVDIIDNHPVWDVYNEQRTARLSVLYYECKLRNLKKLNSLGEFILAASAPSGAVGVIFFQTVLSGILWSILLATASIIAIAKPIFNIPNKIQKYSELLGAWRQLDDELNKLKICVKLNSDYSAEARRDFLLLLEVKSSIVKQEAKEEEDRKLKKRCYEQVKLELPDDDYFVPEET